MCDPMTLAIATAALGVGESVSQYVGMNQQYEVNRQASNYNYARDREAINRQDVQLQEQNSQNVFETAIAAAQARGAVAVSAAEQGLGVPSIAGRLNAEMFGLGKQATTDQINFTNQRQELASNRTDAEIKRQNQINSKQKGSPLSLILGVGKAVVGGASDYKKMTKG